MPRVLVGVRTCTAPSGAPRESYRITPFTSEIVVPAVVRLGLLTKRSILTSEPGPISSVDRSTNWRFVRPCSSVFIRSFCATGAPTVVGAVFLNTPGLTEVARPTVCAEADQHAAKPIVKAIQNARFFPSRDTKAQSVSVWSCWVIWTSQSSTPASALTGKVVRRRQLYVVG